MALMKMEKEYLLEYGDIPDDLNGRIDCILKTGHLKRAKRDVYEEMARIRKIKWNTIRFIIYLLPKSTPRPRSGKSGVFYVKGAKDNKKFFKKYINETNYKMIKTPTKFTCNAYFPTPSSMNIVDKILAEKGYIRPISKPDWDNVAKTYCDMIQGSLIYDDSLIIEGTSRKFYSIKPRIEITIEYMDDMDCSFNQKKVQK